jgi:uncharacterized protein YjbI with pentapeptide repeats
MQFGSEIFKGKLNKECSWSENCFRYCNFVGIAQEGDCVDSIFYGCEFSSCTWYRTPFSTAIFVGTKFKRCKFQGCSIAGCRFIECEFEDRDFTFDSFGRGCSYEDTHWYACTQQGTKGIKDAFRNAR